MNSMSFAMHLLVLLLTSTIYTMGLFDKLDCRLVNDDQVNCLLQPVTQDLQGAQNTVPAESVTAENFYCLT